MDQFMLGIWALKLILREKPINERKKEIEYCLNIENDDEREKNISKLNRDLEKVPLISRRKNNILKNETPQTPLNKIKKVFQENNMNESTTTIEKKNNIRETMERRMNALFEEGIIYLILAQIVFKETPGTIPAYISSISTKNEEKDEKLVTEEKRHTFQVLVFWMKKHGFHNTIIKYEAMKNQNNPDFLERDAHYTLLHYLYKEFYKIHDEYSIQASVEIKSPQTPQKTMESFTSSNSSTTSSVLVRKKKKTLDESDSTIEPQSSFSHESGDTIDRMATQSPYNHLLSTSSENSILQTPLQNELKTSPLHSSQELLPPKLTQSIKSIKDIEPYAPGTPMYEDDTVRTSMPSEEYVQSVSFQIPENMIPEKSKKNPLEYYVNKLQQKKQQENTMAQDSVEMSPIEDSGDFMDDKFESNQSNLSPLNNFDSQQDNNLDSSIEKESVNMNDINEMDGEHEEDDEHEEEQDDEHEEEENDEREEDKQENFEKEMEKENDVVVDEIREEEEDQKDKTVEFDSEDQEDVDGEEEENQSDDDIVEEENIQNEENNEQEEQKHQEEEEEAKEEIQTSTKPSLTKGHYHPLDEKIFDFVDKAKDGSPISPQNSARRRHYLTRSTIVRRRQSPRSQNQPDISKSIDFRRLSKAQEDQSTTALIHSVFRSDITHMTKKELCSEIHRIRMLFVEYHQEIKNRTRTLEERVKDEQDSAILKDYMVAMKKSLNQPPEDMSILSDSLNDSSIQLDDSTMILEDEEEINEEETKEKEEDQNGIFDLTELDNDDSLELEPLAEDKSKLIEIPVDDALSQSQEVRNAEVRKQKYERFLSRMENKHDHPQPVKETTDEPLESEPTPKLSALDLARARKQARQKPKVPKRAPDSPVVALVSEDGKKRYTRKPKLGLRRHAPTYFVSHRPTDENESGMQIVENEQISPSQAPPVTKFKRKEEVETEPTTTTGEEVKRRIIRQNLKLIKNAIKHVCLAGYVNREQQALVLEVLNAYPDPKTQFLLLIRSAKTPNFHGLYKMAPTDEFPERLIGKGPSSLPSDYVSAFFRYDSARKQFFEIPHASDFGNMQDAIVLKPRSLRRKQ